MTNAVPPSTLVGVFDTASADIIIIDDPIAALNQTHAADRSVAPAESEYCSENIWLIPLADAGDTEAGSRTYHRQSAGLHRQRAIGF